MQAVTTKSTVIDFNLIDEGEGRAVFSEIRENIPLIKDLLTQFKDAGRPVRITEWEDKPHSFYGFVVEVNDNSVVLFNENGEFSKSLSAIHVIEDYKSFRVRGIFRSGFGE